MSDELPTDVTVEDPDAYNSVRRIRQIHQTRERVIEHISTIDQPRTPGQVQNAERQQLGFLVAAYITELLPLLKQDGMADKDLVALPDSVDNLQSFARAAGLVETVEHKDVSAGADTPQQTKRAEPPDFVDIIQTYQAANQAFAELGLEIQLQQDERGEYAFEYKELAHPGGHENGS